MRDVDWRMCLRCMSEGEDGRPMVAPMFIAGSAIENLGAGIAHPKGPFYEEGAGMRIMTGGV